MVKNFNDFDDLKEYLTNNPYELHHDNIFNIINKNLISVTFMENGKFHGRDKSYRYALWENQKDSIIVYYKELENGKVKITNIE